ncbi:MAG: serine O-acetyltransferase EpsC [Balneolaceae bacterium]|nr:serine O-acetyltransferase EpsC [Balneolaceae bacterium]MDR9407388.1 serine O-acetyltransferase EpsC [Balneolaceae bacterium]
MRLKDLDFFYDELLKANIEASECPPPEMVIRFFEDILELLFPEFSYERLLDRQAIVEKFNDKKNTLRKILEHNRECIKNDTGGVEDQFFGKLPEIRIRLVNDIDAIFKGDPAAKNRAEVIRTYPGFYALAAHRIAHQLLELGVLLIPRIISEFAHRQTGIDIHPGAQIGEHFCIDHGTGVVIGETTVIGSNVKIYQGVTLGGLSVNKEDASKKRHPTIEDNVVIYAGASILGGETVIGEGSIIGGNVWLTRSVPPNTKIYYKASMTDSTGETDMITFKQES